MDRPTARVIRRYGHDQPGGLVHVDIKKLGNIPDGGGHRTRGRAVGAANSQRTPSPRRRSDGKRPLIGYSYVHTAVDDHSRLAYSEILPDESKESAMAFWSRAQRFFTECGISVERLLTDIQAGTRPFGVSVAPAGGERITRVTGACLSSLVHRAEHCVTPGLLITLVGRATAGMACPVRNPVTACVADPC